MFDSKETVKAQMNALFKALVWPDHAEIACVPLPCDLASNGVRLSFPEEAKTQVWGEKRSSSQAVDG